MKEKYKRQRRKSEGPLDEENEGYGEVYEVVLEGKTEKQTTVGLSILCSSSPLTSP